MKTKLILFFCSMLTFLSSTAQTMNAEPAMADTFRSDGKIYVVIAVLSIIFLCIISYLVYLDIKLKKLEKNNMKKIHIVGIIVIAVAIGVIVYSLGSNASYANFAEAISNPDTEYHVVGKLNKEIPVQYDPKINADECSFVMKDNNGLEKTVVLHKSVPQDFQKSEQVVVIGKMEGANFHANDILMKCPSKYNAGTPQVQ